MSSIRKLAAVLAIGGIVSAAACAPVNFALPGNTASFGLLNPSSFQVSQTNCLVTGGAFGHLMGMNAAAIAGERVQRVQRMAAKFQLAASDIRAQQANWQSIAAGGC